MDENVTRKYCKEKARYPNIYEKIKYDEEYEGREENNTESEDEESKASQYEEEEEYLTPDEEPNNNSIMNQ